MAFVFLHERTDCVSSQQLGEAVANLSRWVIIFDIGKREIEGLVDDLVD